MLNSSETTERLTNTSYNASPASSPERNDRPHLAIPLPHTLTRTSSNSSTISCSSTSELVTPPLSSKASSKAKPSFIDKLFSCKRSRDTLNVDSEKNMQNPNAQENGRPPMKPWHGWQLIIMGSWLNILILLIPASWVLMIASSDSHTLIFIFCVLSMIPLVKLHDLATRQLSIRLGGSNTGLLNASMSNIVEMVVAFIALRKCELRVVQSSLVGSMLSKLLLILGMCFFAGGIRFIEQDFDSTATQIHSSLLSISVGAVLLPAAFHFALSYDADDGVSSSTSMNQQKKYILQMSHGVSIVLLFIYASYLVFQFWSHPHLYKDSAAGSDRLTNSASARSIASRLQGRRKSQGSPSSKGFPTPKPQFSNPPSDPYPQSYPPGKTFSQDTIAGPEYPGKSYTPPRLNDKRSPYMHRTHSSSDEDVDMTPSSRARTAYLISPLTTTSQVTLADSQPGGGSGKGQGVQGGEESTVRLVQMGQPQHGNDYGLEHVRRRRTSVNNSPYAQGGDADEVFSPYVPEKGERTRNDMQRGVSNMPMPMPMPHGQYGHQGQYHQEPLHAEPQERKAENVQEPQMSWTLNLLLLTFVTVLVALNAEWLVDSMDDLSPLISKEWIALILLPTVGSLAECITAVNVSVQDQLTLSIGVAVGSTIQTALFVIPFMVILGWIMDKPLALLFDPFESVVLYISVHTMGYVVADGRSNWLEGVILVCLYIVIGVSFWFYPGSNFSTNLAVCSTSV